MCFMYMWIFKIKYLKRKQYFFVDITVGHPILGITRYLISRTTDFFFCNTKFKSTFELN